MHAELLVLTDFGVCLLVQLVCYPFSMVGRGRKMESLSGLDTLPALCCLLSQSATISRATNRHLEMVFTEDTWRKLNLLSYLHVSTKAISI